MHTRKNIVKLIFFLGIILFPSVVFAVNGNINAQGCVIPQGEATCDMHITGFVQGGVGPFVFVDDFAVPGLLNWTWGPENANGPIDRYMVNFYPGPGNYLYTLVDAGLSMDSTAIVVCAPGTAWDGATCKGPPINGVCGIANGAALAVAPAPSDLCTKGDPSAVAGVGPWTWSCSGKFGGSVAFCSANPPPPLPNNPPIADAGADTSVQLPANSLNLLGSASDTEDPVAALTISWTKIAGPGAPVFDNQNTLQPNVTGLLAGVYTFRLTVKDTGGKIDTDDVVVTVKAAPLPCPPNPNLAGCQLPGANDGDPVVGACAAGFQGAGCNFKCQNGNWFANGANNCVLIPPPPAPCPAMANNNGCQLPVGNNGAANQGQCAVGFQGGGCNFNCVNGVWNEALPNNCQPIPAGCPQVQNINGCQLPPAPDGANAGACGPGFQGGCGFACNNGVWQQQFPNNCVAVPVPPADPDPGVLDGESNIIPCGLKQDPVTKIVSDPCEFKHVIILAKNIINFLLFSIAAPLAAIMFAYAGFLYITNNGNEGKVKQAHDVFLYVFWGFVVCLGAWLTVNMILSFFVDDKYNFLK